MIRYSMEIPTAYLESWTPWTDLDFVLAHKVLEDASYAAFFAKRSGRRELIMDNSMHELGHPLPLKDLKEAALRCRANYIISPDRLGEPEWNADQFTITQRELGQAFLVGAVMCGRTPVERRTYLKHVCQAPILLLPFREPRLEWFLENLDLIYAYFPRVHLLGINTLDELRLFAAASERANSFHWSVDTGKAVKWGFNGIRLDELRSLRGASLRSVDLLNLKDLSPGQLSLIHENVNTLRNICERRSS